MTVESMSTVSGSKSVGDLRAWKARPLTGKGSELLGLAEHTNLVDSLLRQGVGFQQFYSR